MNADIRLLFSTRVLRIFAYGFVSVHLALYLHALGFGERAVGLIFSLALLGDIGISLWITTAADRAGRRRMLVLGALPVAVTLAWMAYGLIVGDWDFFLPRYLYPSLMVYGLTGAVGLRRVLGTDRRIAWLAAALTVALVLVWARVSTVEPFTG